MYTIRHLAQHITVTGRFATLSIADIFSSLTQLPKSASRAACTSFIGISTVLLHLEALDLLPIAGQVE